MLETVDLKKKLAKPAYTKTMGTLQESLRGLQYAAKEAEVPVIICLEGWDMAGKGQIAKKLTEKAGYGMVICKFWLQISKLIYE